MVTHAIGLHEEIVEPRGQSLADRRLSTARNAVDEDPLGRAQGRQKQLRSDHQFMLVLKHEARTAAAADHQADARAPARRASSGEDAGSWKMDAREETRGSAQPGSRR